MKHTKSNKEIDKLDKLLASINPTKRKQGSGKTLKGLKGKRKQIGRNSDNTNEDR